VAVDSLDSDTRADWVALGFLACSCFTSHPLLYHPFLESLPKSKGLGKKAVEGHLESHFYESMWISNWWGVIRRQAVGVAPGKPDLFFSFLDVADFPIEVKREFNNISPAYIHDHYVAQAQSYGGGTRGISFLFILDLTTKTIGIPLPNVVDCCYVDHRDVPNEIHPDYVIVWIFSANRFLPSDHSWIRQKKRAKP